MRKAQRDIQNISNTVLVKERGQVKQRHNSNKPITANWIQFGIPNQIQFGKISSPLHGNFFQTGSSLEFQTGFSLEKAAISNVAALPGQVTNIQERLFLRTVPRQKMTAQFLFFQSLPPKKANFVKKKKRPIELGVIQFQILDILRTT